MLRLTFLELAQSWRVSQIHNALKSIDDTTRRRRLTVHSKTAYWQMSPDSKLFTPSKDFKDWRLTDSNDAFRRFGAARATHGSQCEVAFA